MNTQTKTTLLLFSILLISACGRQSTLPLNSTEALDLFDAGIQATEAPSLSSVPAQNSVAPTVNEIPNMTSEETLNSVLVHLQSILSRMESVEPTQLPPRLAEAWSPLTQRLSYRIEQIENDPVVQQKVVNLVTRLKNLPFAGTYEGLKQKVQQRIAANPERLCQILSKAMNSSRIKNPDIMARIESKYQSDCNGIE